MDKISIDLMGLGPRLRLAREKSGMSISDVYKKTGIGRTVIGCNELGDKLPSLNNFKTYCEIYGVKPNDFLMPDNKDYRT